MHLHAWDIKYTNLSVGCMVVRGATKPARWQRRHWYDPTTTLDNCVHVLKGRFKRFALCDHPTRPSIWKEAALIFFALRLHIPLILPLMLFLLAFSPSMGHLVTGKNWHDFSLLPTKNQFLRPMFFQNSTIFNSLSDFQIRRFSLKNHPNF